MSKLTRNIMHNGFTLIELVVAITLSGIVAGFIVLFLKTPVDAYLAQSRRAELVEEANIVARNMNNDARYALPNSVRSQVVAGVVTMEMLATTDVAIYRGAGTTSPAAASTELDFTGSDQAFTTLGHFPRIQFPCCAPGNYLVVNNDISKPAQNAYLGDPVITSSLNPPQITPGANVDTVTFISPSLLKSASATHHVFLVSGPVAYECNPATRTLRRYSGYTMAAGIAANRNAATSKTLLSNDVSSCTVRYSAGTQYHGGLVGLQLQLSRAVFNSPTESMQIMLQAPVENLP